MEEAPALAAGATAPGSFMWMTHEKIDPEKAEPLIAALPEAEKAATENTYEDAKVRAGRDVLAFAARFPATLVVVFGAIAVWFRSRGGYRPIELQPSSP